MRLAGKRCLITGGSRGIGRAIAQGFAHQGAKVIITYNQAKEAGEELVQGILAQGGDACALSLDLQHTETIDSFAQQAFEVFDGIDVLVNNAGTVRRTELTTLTEKEFDDVFTVNFKSPFFLLQAVSRRMIKQNTQGSIINISSISATVAEGMIAHYECAKAALSMLTRSAALELAPHQIRVNTISPGLTATDMVLKPKDHQKPWEIRLQPIPLGRAGQPQDHVGAAIFLASDESSWVTGSNIVIDGGETLSSS